MTNTTTKPLQLRSYQTRLLAYCVVIADEATVGSLGVCRRHQSRCDDQAEHVVCGAVRAICVSILIPYLQFGYQNETRNFVKFPVRAIHFALLKSDWTGTETYPASISVGTI